MTTIDNIDKKLIQTRLVLTDWRLPDDTQLIYYLVSPICRHILLVLGFRKPAPDLLRPNSSSHLDFIFFVFLMLF